MTLMALLSFTGCGHARQPCYCVLLEKYLLTISQNTRECGWSLNSGRLHRCGMGGGGSRRRPCVTGLIQQVFPGGSDTPQPVRGRSRLLSLTPVMEERTPAFSNAATRTRQAVIRTYLYFYFIFLLYLLR